MTLSEAIARLIAFPIALAIFLSPIIVPIILYVYFKKRKKEEEKPKNYSPNITTIPFRQQSQTYQVTQPTPSTPSTITAYYINTFLLTQHEANFYNTLKPIADKYNLIIFSKIRMADILTVKPHIKKQNFYYWFKKISQKHIDFILCNKQFMPLIFIELDDSTHNKADRIKSDKFKNEVFKSTHLNLLRFRNWTSEDIERDIKICLFGFEAVKAETENKAKNY